MTNKQLRIIAGKWRSRTINFPDIPELRPTQDRIRETLFNWLAPYIVDSICLDLFAGSGALAFEALSRGAKKVIAVDASPIAITVLEKNAAALETQELESKLGKSPEILSQLNITHCDIIFIDPPFNKGLVPKTIEALTQLPLLKPHTLVYIEAEKDFFKRYELSDGWQTLKIKKTKTMGYGLFKYNQQLLSQ